MYEMDEQAKKEFKEEIIKELMLATREAVADGVSQGHRACVCGIDQEKHKESHQKIDEFFGMLGEMGQTARKTFVQILVTAVVALMALGLSIKCGWLKIG